MAKYSEDFKLQLVKEYEEGPLCFRRLAHKHGLPSTSPIKRWVRAYRELGMEGLRRKQRQKDDWIKLRKNWTPFNLN